MPRQPYWLGDTEEEHRWDFCYLDNQLCPGISKVTVEKSRDVDVQKPPGSDGANLSDKGYNPAKVTVELWIYTREQWEAWQDLREKIDPQRAGGLRTPISISHPEPNGLGIDTVYVQSLSGAPPSAAHGKIERIECIQWFKAPEPAKQDQGAPADSSDEPDGEAYGPPPPPPIEDNTFA